MRLQSRRHSMRWQSWKPAFLSPFIEEPIDQDDAGEQERRWSFWTTPLLCGAGLAAQIVYGLRISSALPLTSLWAAAILFVAVRPPRTTSILFATLVAGIVAAQLGLLLVYWEDALSLSTRGAGIAAAGLSLLVFIVVVGQPFRNPSWPSDDIGKAVPTKTLRSPEDDFTLWQWVTVSWVKPLINLGKRRQLNDVSLSATVELICRSVSP